MMNDTFLSSSVYPLPWMIRICLMNVDLPLSPVPAGIFKICYIFPILTLSSLCLPKPKPKLRNLLHIFPRHFAAIPHGACLRRAAFRRAWGSAKSQRTYMGAVATAVILHSEHTRALSRLPPLLLPDAHTTLQHSLGGSSRGGAGVRSITAARDYDDAASAAAALAHALDTRRVTTGTCNTRRLNYY